jgi:histone deacetylase 11
VDIDLALRRRTDGAAYLERLREGLQRLESRHRMAFVLAGTDVLNTDPLGGLALTIDDCVARDRLVLNRLDAPGTPAVMLDAGGYGRDSATAIIRRIAANARR